MSQDSKMHEEKLEKYLNEDHGLESDHLHLSKQSELFKNNDMEGLKKEMKDNLRDIGKTQRDLTGETFNTMSSWKYQSWQAFSQGVNSLLGGLKTLTEADATLKSAQWEYIKTLDQAQQQILSQAMQSMLESSKQSLDQGASFSQALMGFSDKGSGIVHWAA